MATKSGKQKVKATRKQPVKLKAVKAAKAKKPSTTPAKIKKPASIKKSTSKKSASTKRKATKAVTKTNKKTIKPTKKSKKPATVVKKATKQPKSKLQSKTKKSTNKPIKNNDSIMDTQVEFTQPIIGNHGGDLSSPGTFQPYDITVKEDYMNDQQLEHFANILKTWKKELMLEVDNTITEMKQADILADPNDRATQEETFNLELRTRDRERKLIKKIDAALAKIAEQQYGYCDTCGIEIGVRRLEARPTATLCIECKTLAEIREKRI